YVEFHSVLPMLAGETGSLDEIYGCYLNLQRSIRTDKYKLIVYPKAKIVRLYDIKKDPLEMHDLAGDAAMQPTVKELFARLQALQKSMKDELVLEL
ncbi:sulfatase/phosphatase domain-containing protein, partial [Novipirellula sp.]|uniref:sulfatase/phosphatase domain-containing protein n=1 Tax=Novipirellula sp. TaxID=2795430 RepID=UPI003564B13B